VKYMDEYRDGTAAAVLAAAIDRAARRPWALMEVCGGQTHSIVKYGIDRMLPERVELLHGPGCPVCVTPVEMIDRAHAVAERPGVIFCSFGDMLRVPGSRGDLLGLKAKGADVRIVYSPLDALGLAEAQLADNPTLLCDFDLRNPILHKVFRVDRAPGISDYLLGKADLHETLRRIGGSNLFVMPAGDVAVSPLELLHLKEVRKMMGRLRTAFRRILLDSPALLVASDASLLAALADGTLLIGRIGGTNRDSMRRAIETLGQDNILGIVANSARRP